MAANGDGVIANTAEIAAAANWVLNSAHEFNGDIQDLIRETRAVLGPSWNGPTATTHADAWADWFTSALNIIGALEDGARLLANAALSYGVTDGGTAHSITAALVLQPHFVI